MCAAWRAALTRGLGRWTQTCRGIDAEGGTRTPTGLRPLAPEASASTSSTTSARTFEERQSRLLYNPKSMRILPQHRGKNLHRQESQSPARLPPPGNVGGGPRPDWDGGQVAA